MEKISQIHFCISYVLCMLVYIKFLFQYAQVVVDKDLNLPLYRWWSVEAALRHAPLIAPLLKLHTASGNARVRQLLADMGLEYH